MKRLALPILLLATAAHAETATYEALVAKAQAGGNVDYTALRNAYPASPSYDPYGTRSKPLFLDAWKAFEDRDCKTAMEKSQASLEINYVNFALHTVRSECLSQAGDKLGADREGAIAKGLAQSLLATGDGKSTGTAYVVVTMGEEVAVLAYLGFNEEQQALVGDGGHHYDLLSGHDRDGKMQSAYFNIDAPFGGLGKMLDKGEHP